MFDAFLIVCEQNNVSHCAVREVECKWAEADAADEYAGGHH